MPQSFQERMQAQMTPEQRAAQAKYAPASAISSAPVPPPPSAPPPSVSPASSPAGPPGEVPPAIGYRPTLAAAAVQDPLQAQIARAGGGGSVGKALNPYANQIAAADEAKGENLRQQLAMSGTGDARRDAIAGLTSENTRYSDELAQRQKDEAKQSADLEAKHDALLKSEEARDYTKEYWKQKGPARSLGMIIGNAIGAFGAGYGHIPNFAGEIMQKDIDQYITKAQQDSALKIKQSGNVYDHFLQQTKSADQASALTHAALIDGAKGKLAAEAGDEEDLQKREGLIKDARQLDLQQAAWKDAAAVAAKRAAAGQAPLTVVQLAQLAKTIAETKAIEAKTAATQGAAGNPAAQGAIHDLNAARSENGGSLPGGGVLSQVGAQPGVLGGAARILQGEAARDTSANLDTLASAEMQAENPKMRPNPTNLEHFKRVHGYYSDPEKAMARAEKAIARAPASGRDLREEVGGEGEDFQAP
jgi:hypothetical protein